MTFAKVGKEKGIAECTGEKLAENYFVVPFKTTWAVVIYEVDKCKFIFEEATEGNGSLMLAETVWIFF